MPAVTEEIKEALVKNIRRRMTPQPLKIRADIEMKCFQFDGVLHIKVTFTFLSSSPFLGLCFLFSVFSFHSIVLELNVHWRCIV